MATLYAWAWIAREKSWLEGLASNTITEWANDDRLLQDIGGGLSSRMAKRWMDDLGFGWEQMPNFKVQSSIEIQNPNVPKHFFVSVFSHLVLIWPAGRGDSHLSFEIRI
jgi:hypothetical protein